MSPEIRVLVEEPLVIACFLVIVAVPWAAAPLSNRLPSRPWPPGGRSTRHHPPTIERPELRRAGRWVSDSPQDRHRHRIGLPACLGDAGFDAVLRDRDEFLFAFAFWALSVTLAGQLAAGVIAAARAVPFGTLHGMLAGLVAGIIGTLVEVIARTTSGCVTALTIVEGRPCGRPPTVDYIVPYLEIALTSG